MPGWPTSGGFTLIDLLAMIAMIAVLLQLPAA